MSLKRAYIEVPDLPEISIPAKALRAVAGLLLSPIYWLLARRYRTPGLSFHARCVRLGARLLLQGRGNVSWNFLYMLLAFPMDSTRYFEFDFSWNTLADVPMSRCLDVSSPRLLPLMLALHRRDIVVDLLNPDVEDLHHTADLVDACSLGARCRLHGRLVTEAPFSPGTFDAITCISVIEHIPEDTDALRTMWKMVKQGGRLLLTAPCSAEALEQYINRYEYGILEPGEDGYTFWQRLYSEELLRERVFSVTGMPIRKVIYGEKTAGSLQRNAAQKRSHPYYPYWREAYMMGRDCTYFSRIEDLPGEGVVAMEFIKP
ncbi:MAG: class I SAM-dependent methyltransferase [Deltaproteobacteria bacterium]|nr:MAG: class I SAM-dependent methyltransferase [Deltaproteobacteria bacterium]